MPPTQTLNMHKGTNFGYVLLGRRMAGGQTQDSTIMETFLCVRPWGWSQLIHVSSTHIYIYMHYEITELYHGFILKKYTTESYYRMILQIHRAKVYHKNK